MGWSNRLTLLLFSLAAPPTSAAPEPVLYYFQTTPKGCEWRVRPISKAAAATYLTTSECPRDAAFDFGRGHVYFRAGNTIRKANWKPGTTESSQIKDLGSAKFGHIWIDSTTNRMRIAYVKPPRAKCSGEISGAEYGWMCDGKLVLSAAGQATIDEWNGKARIPLATKKAAPHDSDILGLGPLHSEMRSSAKNFSMACFMDHGIYSVGVGCAAPPLPKPSSEQLIKVDARVGKSGQARVLAGDNCRFAKVEKCDDVGEFLAFVPLGASEGLLLGTEVGDNLHLNAPAYYCENFCEKKNAVTEFKSGEELAVSVAGHYLLVQSEKQLVVWRAGNAVPVINANASFAFLAE